MATALVDFEPAFIPGPLIEEPPTPLAIEELPEHGEERPKRGYTARTNLGFAILLSAVEDYMGKDERHHRSAELLLYPKDEHYAHHLRWVCDFTDFPLHYLRATLDRLRPQWNAARQNFKERR